MEALTDKNSLLHSCQRLFSLALPMAGTQLIQVASGFLCMAMLAHLGHHTLAASALIFSTQMSIMVSGMSILFALSILIGHAYGARNYSEIGVLVQQGWTLSLILALPIIFAFWHMGSILIYFGETPEIAGIVQTYFHAYAWAVIPGFLSTCNQQFGYGIHKKTLIISSSFMGVVVLIATSYVLIFGKLGLPSFGVAGLGYAMIAQYTFFFVFTTLYFYVDKSFQPYALFQYRLHKHWGQFKRVISMGWPICLQMGGELMSFFVVNIMVGWMGTTALAAFQVVNQYVFLVVIPLFAVSQASGILVGHACGAKQYGQVKQIGKAAMMIVIIASGVVALTLLLFPRYLASFYFNVNDPANSQVLQLVTLLFMLAAIMQIFDGLRNALIGLLRGLLDTRFPMMVGITLIWLVGMPLAYTLGFTFKLGVVGISLASLLSMSLGALIMFLRWHRMTQKLQTVR
jgi:MATE family multidrug resistance protein